MSKNKTLEELLQEYQEVYACFIRKELKTKHPELLKNLRERPQENSAQSLVEHKNPEDKENEWVGNRWRISTLDCLEVMVEGPYSRKFFINIEDFENLLSSMSEIYRKGAKLC